RGWVQDVTIRDQSIAEEITTRGRQERCPFIERTSNLTAIFRAGKWGLRGGVWVSGVPHRTTRVLKKITSPLIRSGLGKDFDSTQTKLVVLWRKWILIDANFANGVFGRQLSPAEPINIDRATARPGRRSRERS